MTYRDLLALPPHVVGEIVDGELHVSPRPRSRHARAGAVLLATLGSEFDFGEHGAGGWIILPEVEVHLGADVVVPDISGWRRERMPRFEDVAYYSLAPDWVCEVLSPSTAKLDRGRKLDVYARERVPRVWLVDPLVCTIEVLRLERRGYAIETIARDEAQVALAPFDGFALDLAAVFRT